MLHQAPQDLEATTVTIEITGIEEITRTSITYTDSTRTASLVTTLVWVGLVARTMVTLLSRNSLPEVILAVLPIEVMLV